ncbi:MAG: glycosyltransferase family 4 protein [Fimbriiglobus sp.]
MKILVISNLYPPDFLGGYELGCSQAVNALRKAGHDVLVLTSVPRHQPTMSSDNVRRCLRLVDIYSPYTELRVGSFRPIRHLESSHLQAFNIHVIAQAVNDFKPDVVYLWNLVGLGGLGIMLAVEYLGTPWVMHLMDNVLGCLCSTNEILHRNAIEVGDLMAMASRGKFLCCSQTTVDENSASAFPIEKRTTILQNWITTDAPPVKDRKYREKGVLRLVSAGSLSVTKGLDITIKAIGLLRDQGFTNLTLDIYGMGNDVEFRTLVQSLDLTNRIQFCGLKTQRELDRLYPDYDVFVFPTWGREPFAFAPLEAMAHGCLAIITNVCGNAEWFIDRVDCLKIERNPDALALCLKSVLDGEIDISEIGLRAANTVRQQFHLDQLVPKIEAAFSDSMKSFQGEKHSAEETYHLAMFAEKTLHALIFETAVA